MVHRVLRIVFPLMALVNLVLIWVLTGQDNQTTVQLSQGVVDSVENNVLKPNWDSPIAPMLNEINSVGVRKWAHVAEYFPLGIFVFGSFCFLVRASSFMHVGCSFGCCMFCSLLDQVHKHFVPGREFDISDCVFDMGGYLVGIAIFALILCLIGTAKKERICHECRFADYPRQC